MKRTQRQQAGVGALELIEEATHLLRTAPVATLMFYYLGAAPFVLGMLYFWADMSRSPFASRHSADAALGMAGLFLWMKFWQALFARRLRAQLAAEPMPRWNIRQSVCIFLTQAIIQPSGLFAIPLSVVPALPFAWVYAFYQNATVFADGQSDASALIKKSWKHSSLWPWQNHLALGIMSAFACCIFLNLAIVSFSIPHLVKMLFGIESVFTQSPFSLLNTTFFAAMCGATYLCVDPILKAIYVLRGFYGESVQSGEDLKAELKRFSRAQPLAAVVVLLLSLATVPALKAADAPPALAAAPLNVSSTELDHAIDQTIHESKYTWRLPRKQVDESESHQGVIGRFFEKIVALLGRWTRAVFHWLQDIAEWVNRLLQKLFKRKTSGDGSAASSGYGWIMMLEIFLYALVVAAVAAVIVMLFRAWRSRRQMPSPVASQAIQPVPDLADENVAADQLPEDAWTALARELLERGEFRLAMRAFYLASLAHLAQRNLIHIARFKSNREYERELYRRAHTFPGLLAVFGDNLSVFERIWYGMHQVNRELVDHFAANVERIKGAE